MWTKAYIISQILTGIVYILLCLTYIERSRKQILITNILSHFFQGTAFYLLRGFTGLAMCGFLIIRDTFFLIDNKKNKNDKLTKRDYVILCVLIMIILLFSFISFDNVFSLFSIAGTIIATIAIWQKNTKIYRFLGIICCIFWLGYHISLYSIAAIILESFLLVATIIGFIRECKRKNKNTELNEFF